MKRNLVQLVVLADLAALSAAVVLGSLMTLDAVVPWMSDTPLSSPMPMVVALYVGALAGEALGRQLWATSVRRPSYVRAVLVAMTALILVAIGALVFRYYWSRPFLLVVGSSWLIVMMTYRAVWRSRPWAERYVVVTRNASLAEELDESPHADVVRVLHPDDVDIAAIETNDLTLLVEPSQRYSDEVARFASHARGSGSPVRSFPVVFEEHTEKVSVRHAVDGWDAPLSIQTKTGYGAIKRGLDVLGSVILAPIALIVVGAAGLWVKSDSSGPALFRQRRVGRNGRVFTMYKIRTMHDVASDQTARTADEETARITSAGRWLRRLRIDELPQLWNVLKGDLSLIGPRPEQVALDALFEEAIPFYGERRVVRPGITGWAQVHHGYASGVDETLEKLAYDLFYVKHMSFWLDIRILGRSVWTVLSGFGAK